MVVAQGTPRGPGTGRRCRAGAVTAAVLALVSVQHVIWVFSPWPLADEETLARVVVGVPVDRRPDAPLTLGIALLLALAALLVAAGAGWVRSVGPRWVHRWGLRIVAAVLLLRGLAGFVSSGAAVAGLVDTAVPADFLRADLALYSPLCVLLGLGTVLVAFRNRRG